MSENNVSNNDGDSTETGVPVTNGVDGDGGPSPRGLNAVVNKVTSEDSAVPLLALKAAVYLISGGDFTIQELIEAGIVPNLVDCLADYDDPDLQWFALYALALLGSRHPEGARAIVEAGAIPYFLDLEASPDSRFRSEASLAMFYTVWTVPEYEKEFDVLREFTNLIEADPQLETLRRISQKTVSLCLDLNDAARPSAARKLAPVLLRLLQETDDETLRWAVLAASWLVNGNIDSIEVTIITQFISHLVPLLSNSNSEVHADALRALAFIVHGSDQHTQVVLETGILDEFPRSLTSQNMQISSAALRFLSAVTSGKQRHIQTLINHGLVPLIILALDGSDHWTKEDALLLITDLALYGNAEQVQCLTEHGVIPPLCRILGFNFHLKSQLQCVLSVLTHAGNQLEEVKIQLEEGGGVDALEILQEHEDMTIFQFAYHILERFFG